MARYSTKRKFRYKPKPIELAAVEENINHTVDYVKKWKRHELIKMAFNTYKQTPVCVQVSRDAYLIGRFGIRRTNNVWQATYIPEEKDYNFSKRTTAVLFALCNQTGRFKLANEILLYDSQVLMIKEQLEMYNHKLLLAKEKKDSWRLDYFSILSSRAFYRLQDAKNQLEKTTSLAKYIKIWE